MRGIGSVLKRKVSIAIPASLVSDVPHLREKTLRIGMVGRAAAIFGVDEIIVFSDLPNRNQQFETQMIRTILSYMETPQYLRKRLFKLIPELKYVGILPPLRTPHHPLPNRVRDLVEGEYREAVVVSRAEEGVLVDVGVERYALVKTRLPVDARVTVKLSTQEGVLEGRLANREEVESYWGYRVTGSNLAFGQLVKSRAFDLVVATSRHGQPLVEASQQLSTRWRASRKVLVAFGAPARGLYDIVRQEDLELDGLVDFVVNTLPRQEVETVRTEEAVCVALALLSLITAKG